MVKAGLKFPLRITFLAVILAFLSSCLGSSSDWFFLQSSLAPFPRDALIARDVEAFNIHWSGGKYVLTDSESYEYVKVFNFPGNPNVNILQVKALKKSEYFYYVIQLKGRTLSAITSSAVDAAKKLRIPDYRGKYNDSMLQVESHSNIISILKEQLISVKPSDLKVYTVYDYADDAQNAEARRILSKKT